MTELYPHNQEAYKKVSALFRTSNRAAVIHPTGTGKSYIIERLAADFHSVLIVAPNQYVLNETRQRDIVAEFDTYPGIVSRNKFKRNEYDLIVLDEFHHLGAEVWGKGIENLLLMNPNAKIFGTSATEIRYFDGYRDMAEELFEGNVASKISLPEAWVRGILPVPKYIIGMYCLKNVKENWLERLRINPRLSEQDIQNAKEIIKKGILEWETSKGVPSILKKHLPADASRIIVFCDHIDNVEDIRYQFTQWMQKAGFRCATYAVHCGNADSINDMLAFQEDHESGVKVLFAVNMLNEGVHVPDVDAVVMLRNTSSRTIHLQQMGRCMSVSKERQPIIFDFVDNFTNTSELMDIQREYNLLRNSGKTRVNDVGEKVTLKDFLIIDCLKSVRDIQTQIERYFCRRPTESWILALREFIDKYGRWPNLHSNDAEERSLYHYASNHKDNPEIQSLREYVIKTYGWKFRTERMKFEDRFSLLKNFVETKRRWPSSSTNDKSERSLSYFARNFFDREEVKELKRHVIEDYGYKLNLIPQKRRSFDERCIELISFINKNGYLPKNSERVSEEEKSLSRFLIKYRNDERIKDIIKPLAHTKRKISPYTNWISELETYVKNNHRWPHKSAEEMPLYYKAMNLKRNHPQEAERLSKFISDELYRKVRTMDENIARLESFIKEKGRLPSQRSEDKTERSIAASYSKYRNNAKVKSIVENAGLVRKEIPFETRLKELELFISENGRLPASDNGKKEETSLANWLCRNRKEPSVVACIKKLSRVRKLDKTIPFEQRYAETFSLLRDFISKNGKMPTKHSSDVNEKTLGLFVSNHKKEESIIKLKTEFPRRHRVTFEERIVELENFIVTNGRKPSQAATNINEKNLRKSIDNYCSRAEFKTIVNEVYRKYGLKPTSHQ